ncbi:hypothetical protein EV363DRAFT_1295983 [Boletus edulis]|nr:hypothetical protein EV363DRAFT_1295983 [Boletus edulis]
MPLSLSTSYDNGVARTEESQSLMASIADALSQSHRGFTLEDATSLGHVAPDEPVPKYELHAGDVGRSLRSKPHGPVQTVTQAHLRVLRKGKGPEERRDGVRHRHAFHQPATIRAWADKMGQGEDGAHSDHPGSSSADVPSQRLTSSSEWDGEEEDGLAYDRDDRSSREGGVSGDGMHHDQDTFSESGGEASVEVITTTNEEQSETSIRRSVSMGVVSNLGGTTSLARAGSGSGNSPLTHTTLLESSLRTVEEVLGLMKGLDWTATGDEDLPDEAVHIAAGTLFADYGGVIDYREAAHALHEAIGRLRDGVKGRPLDDDSGVSIHSLLAAIEVISSLPARAYYMNAKEQGQNLRDAWPTIELASYKLANVQDSFEELGVSDPHLIDAGAHAFAGLGEFCAMYGRAASTQKHTTLQGIFLIAIHPHPHKHGMPNNLGNSFRARFERLGELRDLEDAISTRSDVVHLTPDGHRDKPSRLNNSGNSFITRFEHLGEPSDPEDTISFCFCFHRPHQSCTTELDIMCSTCWTPFEASIRHNRAMAMGDEGLTDEAIHIAAGMLFAGYGGVIGTMWLISDRLAPVVARGVYEYLFRNGTRADHRDAARALHKAVGRLRESGEAPFVTWLQIHRSESSPENLPSMYASRHHVLDITIPLVRVQNANVTEGSQVLGVDIPYWALDASCRSCGRMCMVYATLPGRVG